MLFAFAHEFYRRYLASNVDLVVFTSSENKDGVTNPWQDVKSACGGGALGAVDDALKLIHTSEKDDGRKLKDVIGMDGVE